MATGNVNLVISANTNLGNTAASLEAMRRGMQAVRMETEKLYRQQNMTGKSNPEAMQNLNEQTANLRNSYRNLIDESGMFAQSTKTITSATTDFNDKLSRQKVRLRDVLGQQHKIRDAMKEQMALNKMQVTGWKRDAMGRIDADIAVPKNINLKSMDAMNKKIGYYNHVLRSVSQETVNWGKNTQWAGRQLTVGFSVPISIAAGLLGRLGHEADAQLVRITKVYGDAEAAFSVSNESLRQMATDTAKHVAEQYGIAATSTRDAMAELAATGLEGSELQQMTVQVQRTSLLGEMSTDDSLKLLRTMKEVYGFSSQQLKEQVDYFNAIENSTALTMQEITEGLPRISGIMKATGTSIQEQTELLVAFKSAGIEVAEGANALKSINFKAIAATPTAKKSFLEITGRDMEALIQKHNAEFLPMMMEIAEIMEELDQPAKMSLVQRVFGIHQGGRAITLIEQLQKGSEAMARAQEAGMKDAASLAADADKEIGDIQESVSNRFNRMVQSIRASLEPIGIMVLETIIPVGEQISKLISWISELPDGVKRLGIQMGLVLAVVGPLVMLAGLMGNLVGMFGRMIGFVVGLGFKFDILNPKAHAASIIQKALETETDRAARAMQEETIAVGNLAKAIDAQNKTVMAHLGITQQHEKALRGAAAAARDYSKYMVTGTVTMHNPPVSKYVANSRGLVGHGADRIARVSPSMDITPASRKAARNFEVDKQNRALREHNKLVDQSSRKWAKVGGAVAATSLAISGVASVTGNQAIAQIANVAFAVSAILPVLGTLQKHVGKVMLGAGDAGSAAANRIKTGFINAGIFGKEALVKLGKFVTGPWGLLIGAGLAVVGGFWAKHQKEVKATRELYEGLADSAKALGEAYDFMPTTPMQRSVDNGMDWDPMETRGQFERIKQFQEENTDFYKLMVQMREQLGKETDEQTRKEMALNEAIRQGGIVLQQTGDKVKANQAAWDAWSIMMDESINFEDFEKELMVEIVLENGEEFETSVLEEVRNVAIRASAEMNKIIAQAKIDPWKVGIQFDNETEARLKAQVTSAMNNIDNIINDQDRYDMFNDIFGPDVDRARALYFEALEQDLIDSETSLAEFVGLWDNWKKGQEGGAKQKLVSGIDDKDIAYAKVMVDAMTELDSRRMGALIDTDNLSHAASIMTGFTASWKEFLDDVEMRDLWRQYDETDDPYTKGKIKEKIRGLNAMAQEEAKVAQKAEEMANASQDALDVGAALGGAPVEGLEDMGEEAEETKKAIDQLSESERDLYDAFKTSMEDLQRKTVDEYRDQFQAIQDAEMKAFDDAAQRDLDAIEDKYDAMEDAADKKAELREKSMSNRHDRESKALDAERDRAREELDAAYEAQQDAHDLRVKAEQKRQKAETKAMRKRHEAQRDALKDRFEAEQEALEDRQEERRQQIEDLHDSEIEKIREKIETEEELERVRQAMYEAERERIRRMQELFSDNIGLNAAINTGDLDEAARIGSEMVAKQSDWAVQDTAALSQEGSDSRKSAMEAEIERIESVKESELAAIAEVEEAEKKSLEARQEAAQEALELRQEREQEAQELRFEQIDERLDAEKKALADANEAARKALDEDFSMRQEAMRNRQAMEKEALDAAVQYEKDKLADLRQTAIDDHNAVTESNRTNLEEQQADAREAFDEIAEHWEGMTAQNFDEWVENNDSMIKDFNRMMGDKGQKGTIIGIDHEKAKELWDQRQEKQKRELDRMANDDSWEDAAKIIVDGIVAGVLGMDFNPKEWQDFIVHGKLPTDKRKVNTGSSMGGRTIQHVKHSGGTIGDPHNNKETGPGFAGKHQEVNVRALKGEGVLNLRAMKTPGVPQLMDALNRGTIGNLSDHAKRKHVIASTPKNISGLAGGGPSLPQFGIMAGITAGIVKQITRAMTLSAMEVGMHKAEQNLSGVDIKLGKDQANLLSAEQLANASAIMDQGKRMNMSDRDIKIALMTAMQESSLRNIDYGDDIYGVRNPDGSLTSSLGLFQQQHWWGSREERMDPYRSSELFYNALKNVKDRDNMSMAQAAQSVQRSAYPDAYAKWESLADVLVGAVAEDLDEQPKVSSQKSTKERIDELVERYKEYEEQAKGFPFPTTGMISWLYGWRNMLSSGADFHNGLDIRAPRGTPVVAVADGTAQPGYQTTGGNYVKIQHQPGLETGYFHLSSKNVRSGQKVRRGQVIGGVGNTGTMSFGNHLHFSVFRPGPWDFVDPAPFMAQKPKLNANVSPKGIGMRNGGIVTGHGFGDVAPRMLEPGEFVVRKKMVDRNRSLLESLNSGDIDFGRIGKNVDNSNASEYNISIEFSGPVKSDVDIEGTVRRTINNIEKRKPQRRSIR